ncbi:MAG: hypothetical protein ACE5HJ_03700 [Thermoplasmata archaeon]
MTSPADALITLLRECDVQSLAAIYYHLRGGIDDQRLRELTDEVVRKSLWQIAQILRALETMLEEASHEEGG